MYYHNTLYRVLPLDPDRQVLEIAKGESLNQVLTRLQQWSVMSREQYWVAKVYLKLQKLQGENIAASIKAGEFKLEEKMTIPSFLALIRSNKQVRYSVTLVEGSTFKQVMSVLKATEKLRQTLGDQSSEQVMSLVGVDDVFDNAHPEGLFFPDTYQYQKGDSDLSILKRAHHRLAKVVKEEWKDRQEALPIKTPYEALILASIVEKETGKPSEREEIAGVFIRRLNKRMRLQTDPTVIYGLGDLYQGNITRKHLREFTPYNTYRINGLPPTPIALAGREAIHAALNPAKGTTLYFVAKGDGSHQFSTTIEEHNRAVRQYQLKRRSDYRSTHQATK